MMDKIYVIMGTTGEYSDRTEWPVCAVLTEEEAVAQVKRRVDVLNEMQVYSASSQWAINHKLRREVEKHIRNLENFDPSFCVDYTGSDYYYFAVPFNVAQPKEK